MTSIRVFPTSEFGNSFATPFVDRNGLTWPTVEHYYQAHKFEHIPDYYHLIRFADNPEKAFLLGTQDVTCTTFSDEPVHEGCPHTVHQEVLRHAHIRRRDDWELIKISVMFDAIAYKFTQHHRLMWKLLATQDDPIYYVLPHHSFWGVDHKGNGLNWIGYLLQKLRYEMRQGTQPPPVVPQHVPKGFEEEVAETL